MNIKLKPSMREKRHYLLIKVFCERKLEEEEIKKRIKNAIMKFIGVLGYANAGPVFPEITDEKVLSIMREKNLAIVSITTKFVAHVKASLLLAKEKNLRMECIKVSGTIRKLCDFIKENSSIL